jgi:hypothetical protein
VTEKGKEVTVEEFVKVWNDLEAYPSLQHIADEVGLTYLSVKKKSSRLRRKRREGDEAIPALVDRSNASAQLLQELHYEFREKMTEQECLASMQGLYNSDPGINITRIRYREATGIADATWTRYFGTFLEFKRASGIDLTRHQHKLERNIAQHRAADHYRAFNDRAELDNRYNKPSGKRIKTILGCSDLHDEEIDPFYLRVLIEAIRMLKPDVINLGGDIFDLAEFGKYGVDPREWGPVGKIRFVHEQILAPMREASPDSQIDFIEGNHEFRLLRHLADATPALKAILSDLHGFTIPKLLGLDQFEINYIAKADMAAFNKGDMKREIEKSYVIYDQAVLVHHHPHAAQWGLPGWNGHHHLSLTSRRKSALLGSIPWLQLGSGHRRRASYAEGEFWSNGFNICHLNTESKSVINEVIDITDIACVGGVYFDRRPEEMVGFYGKAA